MSSTNHTPLEHNVLTGILIHIIEPIDVDDYIEFHIRRPDMDKDSIWSISMTIPDKDRFVNRRMSEKRYDLPIPISLPSNKIEISYVSMLQCIHVTMLQCIHVTENIQNTGSPYNKWKESSYNH